MKHYISLNIPYSHLISGGKATVARMFVNNSTGQRGLVCQYDVVCFDEISGVSFDQRDGVNIWWRTKWARYHSSESYH